LRAPEFAWPGALAAPLAHSRRLAPGLAVSAVVAVAAAFLAQHYGAPVMLFALLVGMALNFLTDEPRCAPGIDFAARQVLRLGVALLGLRITASQVASLGWETVGAIVLAVALTIACGILLARLFGFQMFFGLLTGGAVAICGASAALALAAAMPSHPQKERATVFTVIGVSALSTLAMIGYPLLARLLGHDAHQAGVFLGGTIHDVAQVVGAGYSLSQEAGDTATIVKLLRVALLLPVILLAAALARWHTARKGSGASTGTRPPLLPWFALAFFVLVALRSVGVVPAGLVEAGKGVSHACLVAAMAAIGLKTRLKDVATVGWRPVALMVAETAFLAGLFLAALASGWL
jgi:uncharacterized integral membrane protein (TIGR00698 family)